MSVALSSLVGQVAGEARLPPRALHLLTLLVERGSLEVREAYPLLGLSRAQTSRLAVQLVEHRLVSRRPVAGDKRRVVFVPTIEGRALAAHLHRRVGR